MKVRTSMMQIMLLALCLFYASSARADFVASCEPWLEQRFEGTPACQVSTRSSQDFRGNGELTVNQDAFFAKQDWVHATSVEGSQGSGLAGRVDLTMWLQSDAIADLLVIFKGPSSQYLVGLYIPANWGDTELSWLSPFKHKKPNKYMDVSHISIYQRPSDIIKPPDPQDVNASTPTLVFLVLFSGLWWRQKRHRHVRDRGDVFGSLFWSTSFCRHG